jgi:predicted translin family RNA/ssDNA-binding protein
MNKLTKRDIDRRDHVLQQLREVEKEIDEATVAVNALIDEKLNAAIKKYNEVVGEAESLKDDIVAAQEEFFDGRSEKWQEGEKGEAYTGWKDEWENYSTDEIEEVALIDLPETQHAELLEGLPEAPE